MSNGRTTEEFYVNSFGDDFILITGTGVNTGDWVAITALEDTEMGTITKAGVTISTNFPIPAGVTISCAQGISAFTLASGKVLAYVRRPL